MGECRSGDVENVVGKRQYNINGQYFLHVAEGQVLLFLLSNSNPDNEERDKKLGPHK